MGAFSAKGLNIVPEEICYTDIAEFVYIVEFVYITEFVYIAEFVYITEIVPEEICYTETSRVRNCKPFSISILVARVD